MRLLLLMTAETPNISHFSMFIRRSCERTFPWRARPGARPSMPRRRTQILPWRNDRGEMGAAERGRGSAEGDLADGDAEVAGIADLPRLPRIPGPVDLDEEDDVLSELVRERIFEGFPLRVAEDRFADETLVPGKDPGPRRAWLSPGSGRCPDGRPGGGSGPKAYPRGGPSRRGGRSSGTPGRPGSSPSARSRNPGEGRIPGSGSPGRASGSNSRGGRRHRGRARRRPAAGTGLSTGPRGRRDPRERTGRARRPGRWRRAARRST